MKALVIYDTEYGNTEKIARAIGAGFEGEVKVIKVADVKPEDIAWARTVIIGSPTQGGRQTPAVKTFVESLPAGTFDGKRLAAFDTRLKNFIVRLFGWAADKIENSLKGKGGNITAQPQGFYVKSTKGPLMEGEEDRATTWAKAIAAGVPTDKMPGEYRVKTKE